MVSFTVTKIYIYTHTHTHIRAERTSLDLDKFHTVSTRKEAEIREKNRGLLLSSISV